MRWWRRCSYASSAPSSPWPFFGRDHVSRQLRSGLLRGASGHQRSASWSTRTPLPSLQVQRPPPRRTPARRGRLSAAGTPDWLDWWGGPGPYLDWWVPLAGGVLGIGTGCLLVLTVFVPLGALLDAHERRHDDPLETRRLLAFVFGVVGIGALVGALVLVGPGPSSASGDVRPSRLSNMLSAAVTLLRLVSGKLDNANGLTAG